jgi:SAM-dependent methyltransferase
MMVGTDIDKEAVEKVYARWAPVYDLVFGAVFERGRRAAVAAGERVGGRILEVGVGTGLSLPYYSGRNRVVGIDLSEQMLVKARERVVREQLNHVEELAIMDAEQLDFPEGSFDVVAAQCVVNTVPDPEKALEEFARVLKPCGEIVLLNRVGAEAGPRRVFERLFQPIANRCGWRSDFPWSRFDSWLAGSSHEMRLLGRQPVPPFGHFSIIRFGKLASIASLMESFFETLREQRWDDHRYYHHSRINQSLHLLSAASFVCAYCCIFNNPVFAVLLAWLFGMTSRQIGHFFFEPRDYDHVNEASHDHKEEIKVGYNLQRKVVLMSVWALSPLLLLLSPTLLGIFPAQHSVWDFMNHVALMWLAIGVGGLLFRTIHLCFIRDPQTALAWMTKIITDPFCDIQLYHKAPLRLLRGELIDPMHHVQHGEAKNPADDGGVSAGDPEHGQTSPAGSGA